MWSEQFRTSCTKSDATSAKCSSSTTFLHGIWNSTFHLLFKTIKIHWSASGSHFLPSRTWLTGPLFHMFIHSAFTISKLLLSILRFLSLSASEQQWHIRHWACYPFLVDLPRSSEKNFCSLSEPWWAPPFLSNYFGVALQRTYHKNRELNGIC